MAGKTRFTLRQRKFCYWYPRLDGNGSKAAEKAGYGKDRAGATAGDLLKKPHVVKAIERELTAMLRAHGENEETVLARYSRWSDANAFHFLKENEDGNLVCKEKSAIPEEMMDCVQSIRVSQNQYGQQISITLVDKIRANDQLGKYLGLFALDEGGTDPEEYAKLFMSAVKQMEEVENGQQYGQESDAENSESEQPGKKRVLN